MSGTPSEAVIVAYPPRLLTNSATSSASCLLVLENLILLPSLSIVPSESNRPCNRAILWSILPNLYMFGTNLFLQDTPSRASSRNALFCFSTPKDFTGLLLLCLTSVYTFPMVTSPKFVTNSS